MKKKSYSRYTRPHLFRRNLRFWLIYLVLVALIVIGFTRVYSYFDTNLKKYEASQYEYLADEIGSIFTERRFDELYTYEKIEADYLETKEDYVAYLNDLTGGKEILYTQVSSTDPKEVRYQVTADGASFAEYTLRKTGETFTFEVIPMVGYSIGTDLYGLKEIKTDVIQPVTYDYTIPSTATITVNGKPLPEKAIVKSGEKVFFDGHLPADYPVYTLTSYRFTCALGTPDIQVTAEDGSPLQLTDLGNETYRTDFNYSDDEMKKSYEEYGLTFVKLLCRYTTDNCKLATILAKVQGSSPAYESITSMDTKWRTKAKDYSFLNVNTCNYARYSDTLYSCEVTMTYHCTYSQASKVNDYETSCRVFFVKEKNDWLVYDFMYLQ